MSTWHEIYENGHQKLIKRFEFDGFRSSLDFVLDVARIAENESHHPDILIEYNVVTIKCWSHDKGAITERDKKLSKAIDELMSESH